MLLPILFTLLFIAVSVPLVVTPLRQRARAATTGTARGGPSAAPDSYETTLLAMRDLEFDHQLGVVTDDDYARLREQLMAQAATALETSRREEAEEIAARIEAAVLARRRQPAQERPTAAARFCPQCGNRVDAGDRFCTGCGAPLR